ncbi:MAG: restriction endonuclease subunit S [Nocardioides sp.]|uniref:restriction endonuclease subunit S n=1 Tax=Nocardioides sp. TaxID=35761 RepID=UPI00238CE05B|nr:restriction endonuclease subunit S [Nocardioides sp.]MDE0775882.1 restriction endonuclease subunit S [Nocardioides sp.]
MGDVLSLHRVPVQLDEAETYRQIGLYSWGKGFIHRPSCLGFELSKLRYFEVPAGALVLSNIQAWEAAIAVSTNAEAEFVGSNRFLSYLPRTSDVDVRYLLHYFLSEPGLHQIRQASPGTQVRNRTLGQQLFERLEIPLPDITEQHRIAARLDRTAETSLASNDLEEFELTWRHLVERLTFGSLISPQRIGDVLQPKSMELVDRDSAYQVAGVFSFGRGLLSRGTIKGADTKYKLFTRLDRNDLVYSKLGAFEGAVAVVPSSYEDFYVSPEFPVFEVQSNVDPTFLRYCVIAEPFVRQLVAATSGVGARQKRVSPGAFLELSVPIPSLREQREIARRLDLASRTLELKKDAVRIRKALLPAARNDVFTRLT